MVKLLLVCRCFKLSCYDWFYPDVSCITWNHRASMMQQFSTKTFSLNCLTPWQTHFWLFSGPKLWLQFPFMKDFWLGMYHYGNHSLPLVSFLPKYSCHLKVWRLFLGHYLQIHYYLAQTVIFTGNLHLAEAYVCRGNRNQTPVGALGGFFPLSSKTASRAARHIKAASWK